MSRDICVALNERAAPPARVRRNRTRLMFGERVA